MKNEIENKNEVVEVEAEQAIAPKKDSKFKSAVKKVGDFVGRNKKKIIAGAVIIGGAAIGVLTMRRGESYDESDCDCDTCDGDCSNCGVEVSDYEVVTESETEE